MKDKQSLVTKFVGPVVKTCGVCFGAYLIMCLVNAYAPEKDDSKKKTPVKMKESIINKSNKLLQDSAK